MTRSLPAERTASTGRRGARLGADRLVLVTLDLVAGEISPIRRRGLERAAVLVHFFRP